MAEKLLAKGEAGQHQCDTCLKLFDFIGNGQWIPTTCPDCKAKGTAIDPLTLARRIGATHRDGRNPNVFYKQERGQTLKAVYDDGDLTIWRYFSAHPPESAGVI